MTSVLTLVKSACYEQNQPAPSSLFGSTDPSALQYLNLFYSVGRDLLSQCTWPQLKKTATITTSNGTTTYALPSDFYSFISETQWDQTLHRPMIGPQSDENFNIILYGVGAAAITTTYRIFGLTSTNQIEIRPTPGTTNHTLSYDYISNAWILHSSTWQTTLGGDTDTCAFDDDLMILGLKWKWLQAKGQDFTDLKQEYDSKVGQARDRWNGTFKGSFNRYSRVHRRYLPSTSGGWSF